jgi:hypothetical protein
MPDSRMTAFQKLSRYATQTRLGLSFLAVIFRLFLSRTHRSHHFRPKSNYLLSSAHGQSFHTSIWFVSLSGITEESHVEQIRVNYETVGRHFTWSPSPFNLSPLASGNPCSQAHIETPSPTKVAYPHPIHPIQMQHTARTPIGCLFV